jgi:hypothetical protein
MIQNVQHLQSFRAARKSTILVALFALSLPIIGLIPGAEAQAPDDAGYKTSRKEMVKLWNAIVEISTPTTGNR